ncbi:GGDEF domain-containing protein [Brevundimonas sp. Root1279]|uniref:GGDEF domain-containing protein n=1 Tax=Brevundimonas sp. Root1279 TaxID=1736443 RepID=UPI0006F3C410|nr:GGDEF domain-containing protein [Brevundimonas sp. Root1279]KQW83637.1 diguanylate cyclase [Brevundimonas sp. Root1279]
MTAQVETTLRGPDAYSMARRAIEAMEKAGVWPTPLNFELWVRYLGDPDSALGREIERMIAASEPFTEATAEMLAAEYLMRGRLTDEICDAGRVLDRELSSVSAAVAQAHRSQAAYGRTLAGAAGSLDSADDADALKTIVSDLSEATRKAQQENQALEVKLEASTREVARLSQHLEQVRLDAMTDALTNLANRKAFDEHLDDACEKALQKGEALSLAVLDIDHFKRFNDTWGHQTGDQVIRYVASVLSRAAQTPRIAARYGGEEFAMIFPRESLPEVEKSLETIRKEIASRALRRRSTNDDLGAVTVSIGFAHRRGGEPAASLLGRADAALYASKRSGRNKVTCADWLDDAA